MVQETVHSSSAPLPVQLFGCAAGRLLRSSSGRVSETSKVFRAATLPPFLVRREGALEEGGHTLADLLFAAGRGEEAWLR